MGLLINGKWSEQWYEADDKGQFQRPQTQFRAWVRSDGSSPHTPEADRYHLYVSLACPWAHRTLILRQLKGLHDAISLSVVDPYMGSDGWEFSNNDGCIPDPIHGARFLRDIYLKAKADYTGRVTVPVLWDKKLGTIVNNESREIMRMLDTEFNDLATTNVDFYPGDLRVTIDATIDAIYEPINNGVYRSGFANSQAAYDQAVAQLFDALDHWEAVLDKQRYLCGSQITEADWCLFTTLLRFDPVYVGHFKCNLRRILDYPNLANYLRDLYQVAGVAQTCNIDHIKQHYYRSHDMINPTRIVPSGPELTFDHEHDRNRFA